MQIKLVKLEYGTIFKYNGNTFKMESSNWSLKGVRQSNESNIVATQKEYDSTETISMIRCSPFLGGQYQYNIPFWFSVNTIVEIS